jgi:DNA-binding transcriptional ArsR family regulator
MATTKAKAKATKASAAADAANDARLLELFKALSNPTRLQILRWLGDPDANFDPQEEPAAEVGVCVKQIQAKAGISQSTASQFMGILQRAGLVSSRRIGRWTYFKREDERIASLPALLRDGL